MTTASPRPLSSTSPSAKWSLYAGVYAYIVGTLVLLPVGFMVDTLLTILDLGTEFSAFVMAAPAAVIGSVLWWAVVERRDGYTYPAGVAVGLGTAALTVAFWVCVFVLVWGVQLVLNGGILIAFVIGLVLPAGAVAGFPLLYARRHLDDSLPVGR